MFYDYFVWASIASQSQRLFEWNSCVHSRTGIKWTMFIGKHTNTNTLDLFIVHNLTHINILSARNVRIGNKIAIVHTYEYINKAKYREYCPKPVSILIVQIWIQFSENSRENSRRETENWNIQTNMMRRNIISHNAFTILRWQYFFRLANHKCLCIWTRKKCACVLSMVQIMCSCVKCVRNE